MLPARPKPSHMGGPRDNDGKTASPIKHVIVIMGENRTFDHVFATYQPREGEHVDNLLSKGIIKKDGSPGPNYAKATQFAAVDNNVYSISPGQKTPYDNSDQQAADAGNLLRTADLLSRRRTRPLSTVRAAWPRWRWPHEADYGLRPQDLPLLTTGATGLPGNSPDTRILNYNNLPNGPYPLVTRRLPDGASLYDTYGGSPVHRFYQMWQQLDCDVGKATAEQSERLPGRSVPLGRGDGLLRQQRRSVAAAARGRRHRDGLL